MKGKSVDKIMSSFSKTINQLKARSEQADKEAARLEEEEVRVKSDKLDALRERDLADKMTEKLEDIFSLDK